MLTVALLWIKSPYTISSIDEKPNKISTHLKTAFNCNSGGKYSWTNWRVFQILLCIEPSNSAPNLLNSLVNKIKSQSCRSAECRIISSLTVSKNSAYTFVWLSINIFRKRSKMLCKNGENIKNNRKLFHSLNKKWIMN